MAASTRKKADKSPHRQLDEFLDKYTPEVANAARDCLKTMRARLPGATELVYDTYNALAIGFGPSEKASDAIFSIVLYPRYVTLFFLQGVHVPDAKQLLQGQWQRGSAHQARIGDRSGQGSHPGTYGCCVDEREAGNRPHRSGWFGHQIDLDETASAPAKSRSLSVSCGANQAKM
jgi:hypothetical protein